MSIDLFIARESQNFTLGATTHGSALVQISSDAAAARENERLERLEILLALIDPFFQPTDLFRADAIHAILKSLGRRRQLAAQIEKLVLKLAQHLVEKLVRIAGYGKSEPKATL